MRKYSILLLSSITLILFAIGFSSCKDDEPVKYSLSFSKSTDTAIESDANIEIQIKLDKPAPEDITVDYELTGTAFDNIRADAEEESTDFVIDGDYGQIDIAKGETTATITLVPYSDDLLEDDETIVVNFSDVDNANVSFETTAETTITLAQEDGMLVLLQWPGPSTDGVADLDFFVRIAETKPNLDWDFIITGFVYRGYDLVNNSNKGFEYVFLPKSYIGEIFGLSYSNSTYGLTYTYYDGSLDPLNFTATFMEFTDGDFEDDADFDVSEGSYTANNLNKWSGTAYPNIVAQTFVNNNGVFSDISPITAQETSSRVASISGNQTFTKKEIRKTLNFNEQPQRIKNILNKR